MPASGSEIKKMRRVRLSGSAFAARHHSSKKVAYRRGYLRDVSFESEMPGVEELHFRIGIVPLEGFGTGRKGERISPELEVSFLRGGRIDEASAAPQEMQAEELVGIGPRLDRLPA